MDTNFQRHTPPPKGQADRRACPPRPRGPAFARGLIFLVMGALPFGCSPPSVILPLDNAERVAAQRSFAITEGEGFVWDMRPYPCATLRHWVEEIFLEKGYRSATPGESDLRVQLSVFAPKKAGTPTRITVVMDLFDRSTHRHIWSDQITLPNPCGGEDRPKDLALKERLKGFLRPVPVLGHAP